MTQSPWLPIVLLLGIASYAAWRAVVYFKKKRPAFAIAVCFAVLLCVYEAAIQIIRIFQGGGGSGGGGTGGTG